MHYGFKFSTAIYTSYFTGKSPTNYAGREILSDNIFYQLSRADILIFQLLYISLTTSSLNMKFVGPKFPTLFLLGEEKSTEYFRDTILVNEESKVLNFLQDQMYNSFLEDAAR